MTTHILPLVLVPLLVMFSGCKQPQTVEKDDGVQCCFTVPYEGLNGQTVPVVQCKSDLVCPKDSDKTTADVCMPFDCKAGDSNPYGQLGPGGASVVSGNCSFDAQETAVKKEGCPVDDGGAGAGTDQPSPPNPPPGGASGADSTGT